MPESEDARTGPAPSLKKCPWCAEDIQPAAVICRFCGRELSSDSGLAPVGTPPPSAPSDLTLHGPRKATNKVPLLAGAVALLVAAAVTGGLLLTGHSKHVTSATTTTSAPDTPANAKFHELGGTLDLNEGADDSATPGTACHGSYASFPDITEGASVVATNQSGQVIGTTTLEQGTIETVSAGINDCEFSFGFSALPTEQFYGIEVSDRGVVQYSFSQLNQDGWSIAVSLNGG